MSTLGNRATTAPTHEEAQVTAAIRDELLPMLRKDPQMVEFRTVARAVLAVITGLPRVPRWRGRRTLVVDRSRLVLDVTAAGVRLDLDAPGHPERWVMIAGPAEARSFFLAGLAACAAVEDPSTIDPMARDGHSGDLDSDLDADDITPLDHVPVSGGSPGPDCATTTSAVTLESEQDHAGPGHPDSTPDPDTKELH